MRLKNILIVVKDIEKAKCFYHDLFGLGVIRESGGNVILTEGLVLQEESVWKSCLGRDVIAENNCCELYFEEADLEAFVQKLENTDFPVNYVTELTELDGGQKIVRFYDPDGNLIEVRTPFVCQGEAVNIVCDSGNHFKKRGDDDVL